jgi:hypothetical protein
VVNTFAVFKEHGIRKAGFINHTNQGENAFLSSRNNFDSAKDDIQVIPNHTEYE